MARFVEQTSPLDFDDSVKELNQLFYLSDEEFQELLNVWSTDETEDVVAPTLQEAEVQFQHAIDGYRGAIYMADILDSNKGAYYDLVRSIYKDIKQDTSEVRNTRMLTLVRGHHEVRYFLDLFHTWEKDNPSPTRRVGMTQLADFLNSPLQPPPDDFTPD